MPAETQEIRPPGPVGQTFILLSKSLSIIKSSWSLLVFHVMIVLFVFAFVGFTNLLVRQESTLRVEKVYAPRRLSPSAPQPLALLSNSPYATQIAIAELTRSSSSISQWVEFAVDRLKQRLNLPPDALKRIYKGPSPSELLDAVAKAGPVDNFVFFCHDFDLAPPPNSSPSPLSSQPGQSPTPKHKAAPSQQSPGATAENPLFSALKIACDSIELKGRALRTRPYIVSYNMTLYTPEYLRDPNDPLGFDANSVLIKSLIDEAIIVFERRSRRGIEEINRTEGGEDRPEIGDKNAIFAMETGRGVKKTQKQREASTPGSASDGEDFTFEIETLSYPKPGATFLSSFDAMTAWSSFFYLFIALLSFSQAVRLMAGEKDLKIRRGLAPLGLSGPAYLASWLLFWMIFDLFLALGVAAVGVAAGSVTFATPQAGFLAFWVLYAVLVAYKALGILVATLCEDFKGANRVAYTVIVLSLFLQLFFSQRVTTDLFFAEGRTWMIAAADFVLGIFPSFAFSVIFNNLHYLEGSHLNPSTFNYEKGDGYNFTVYFTRPDSVRPVVGRVSRPSDFSFHLILLALSVAFFLAAAILDWLLSSSSSKREVHAPSERANEDSPLFDLKGVKKRYPSNNVQALDGASLALAEGRVTALLGENGAGKSSLISVLTGLEAADEGTIEFRGQPFGRDRRDFLKVSVCPQFDLLWPSLSAQKNLEIQAKLRGLPSSSISRKIRAILEDLGLGAQRRIPVCRLSGGTRRRVSIAAALLGGADLLVLDEPTTGLDPLSRRAVWDFVRKLKAESRSILLTTHIMDEADLIADSVAIISKGKILAHDSPAAIKARFQRMNLVFGLKKSSVEFFSDLEDYFRSIFGMDFEVKFKSDSVVKINVPSRKMEQVYQVVEAFENMESNSETQKFFDFVENFEVSSLDLEEAFILINEENEAKQISLDTRAKEPNPES